VPGPLIRDEEESDTITTYTQARTESFRVPLAAEISPDDSDAIMAENEELRRQLESRDPPILAERVPHRQEESFLRIFFRLSSLT
jgi:hypothetical protein